jgi:hypothetical protein
MTIVQLTHDIYETLVNYIYLIQRSSTNLGCRIMSLWMNGALRSYAANAPIVEEVSTPPQTASLDGAI